ncbi:M17 family metallopeptidase [Chryseobacterium sp.]|uniref:M17 family metallopeptidase n=1 Tax=Chryseobacterium sp. TaxID=1871047 RepID=UPI003890E2B8
MKVTTNKKDNYNQIFQLYSEISWQSNQYQFPSSISSFFTGKKNEVFVYVEAEKVIYLIGLGKDDIQNFEFQQIGNKFAQAQKNNLHAVPTLLSGDNLNDEQFSQFITGLLLGTYNYPFKKDHSFWNDQFELNYSEISGDQAQKSLKKAVAICNAQSACQDWLNKPANFKKPDTVTKYLSEIATQHNLKHTTFNREKCEELGLGAYLSVNQGSAYDAAFTILEYKTDVPNAKTFGLVGKCVVFDTGGISIKASTNLHYMKSDMGGATAVIGALLYAAEMKLPININAILPITDNAVSEKSYLPSDVITAYNGKTIEVLDTDAEGRMTLADGLSYLAKNYKTDVLLDLATLTGSSVRMFGDTCGALLSNNDQLIKTLIKTGDKTNQRLWNLPLWDIWMEDFKSDVADFKNFSMKPVGDCIIAAKFLEQFIENHPNWAHLDIAGVVFGSVGYARDKAATGFGVQLLADFLENYQ